MRNLYSLIVPKNAKGDHSGFFIELPVAKYQKNEGGPLETLECF